MPVKNSFFPWVSILLCLPRFCRFTCVKTKLRIWLYIYFLHMEGYHWRRLFCFPLYEERKWIFFLDKIQGIQHIKCKTVFSVLQTAIYTGKAAHVQRSENIELQGTSYVNLSHKVESSNILQILVLITDALPYLAVANK